jgi:hypothetical protein
MLWTHQNNFHKKTLKNLAGRFAQILNLGKEVPEGDRELFEYFATHYKNSNNGIKGRGKARKVTKRKPESHPNYCITTVPQYSLPQIAAAQQIPSPHNLPVPSWQYLAASRLSVTVVDGLKLPAICLASLTGVHLRRDK